MPCDDNTLILEVFCHDNQLKMCVFEHKEIVPTVRQYSQFPFSFQEIERLSAEITSLLNKTNKSGILKQDSINALKKNGSMLWDLLLSRTIKEKLKHAVYNNLVLSLDEELIHIPWELLFDGDSFLCLKFSLGRLVRAKEKSGNPNYRELSGPLKMLVLANPTNDLDNAYLEGLNIKNNLDKKRDKITVDFKSTDIDTMYVKKNLRDYDLVHFAGHCEYDTKSPLNTAWLFSNGRFSAQDIQKMGEALPLPSLVFSNGCQTACQSANQVDADYQRETYSLASAFLFSGVRHYIGTIRKIEDAVSFAFADEFYAHLVSGKSVGECIRLSRLRLIKQYGICSVFWASYLLYGDPNFRLFGQPRTAEVKKQYKPAFRKLSSWAAAGAAALCLGIFSYFLLPSVNPNTYLLFMKSQQLLKKGMNQDAAIVCDQIIKNDPLFLAAYPRIAQACERQGKRNDALKYYFEYALSSQKKNDLKNLSSAYIGIGWIYHENGQYPKAIDFYNKALNLSKSTKDLLHEAVALRKLAVWYMDRNDDDKALEFLTKSSEINLEKKHIYEHKYNLACDYFDMGLLFTNKEDYQAANKFYAKSLKLFEGMNLKDELSDYYFNLGEIYLFEKGYQKALDCYLKGLSIDKKQDNKPSLASDYNMLGELYLDMDNLEKAEEAFGKAETICKQIDSRSELASIHYNFGILYKKKNRKSASREYLRLAEEFYRQIGSNEYENVKKELLELDN